MKAMNLPADTIHSNDSLSPVGHLGLQSSKGAGERVGEENLEEGGKGGEVGGQ